MNINFASFRSGLVTVSGSLRWPRLSHFDSGPRPRQGANKLNKMELIPQKARTAAFNATTCLDSHRANMVSKLLKVQSVIHFSWPAYESAVLPAKVRLRLSRNNV